SNLILITELGTVHLGPFSAQITKQLQALDQMRELPSKVPLDQILYINLRNPASPLLELNQSQTSSSNNASDPALSESP
ncbi:MAG TPA: hypothetical protein V6C78_12580, partial [Crinalium sp.]